MRAETHRGESRCRVAAGNPHVHIGIASPHRKILQDEDGLHCEGVRCRQGRVDGLDPGPVDQILSMPGAETLRIFGQDDGESAFHFLDAAVPAFMGTVESDELVVLRRHAARITPSGVTGGATDPYLWTGSAICGAVDGTRHPEVRALAGEDDSSE